MAKVFSSFDQGAKFRQIWSYCSALPFIVVKYFPAKRSRRKVKKNFFSVINYKNKTFIWASFSSFYIGQIRPLLALFRPFHNIMTINGKSVYAVLGLWTRVRSSRFQDWSLYWISVGFPPYILQGQETGSNQFWILLTKLCFQDVTKFALFPFVKYLLSFHKIVCPPVRPDLAKFCHFGKRIKELFVGIWQNLAEFWTYLWLYFAIGKML